jgi:Holliday junction resolvase RusA-like endonuclease
MTILAFTIPGQPVPWMRADGNGKRRFTPTPLATYETLAGLHAMKAAAAYRRRTGTAWPTAALYAVRIAGFRRDMRRADADNIAKAIMDGVTGAAGIWDDDCRVVDMRCVRALDRESPRLTMIVRVVPADYAQAEALAIEADARRVA